MKVLLLSTYDIEGGAARAAYRLHQGLGRAGVDSRMLVQFKASDDACVIGPQSKRDKTIAFLRPGLDSLPLSFYRQRQPGRYSLQWFPDRLPSQVSHLNPDILNLHWVSSGFLRLETIARFSQPVVWTLHDMAAFTGGCHYTDGCDRYRSGCGACPQLGSHREWDLSRWVWQRKAALWQHRPPTIVTPSRWLADCAAQSPLLAKAAIHVIPNGIDTQQYRPRDRAVVRELLGLPQDKQLLLFGAMEATHDRRKGFHLLQPALQHLSQQGWGDRLELVIFGASRPTHPPEFGFPTHYLGRLGDDLSLSLVYAAADGFVAPSLQDNLPNTVLEAMACGLPCVAFRIGGLSDLIDHQETGYLAVADDIADLATGICWILEQGRSLGDRTRQKVEQQFSLALQAQRYLGLFQQGLEKPCKQPSAQPG